MWINSIFNKILNSIIYPHIMLISSGINCFLVLKNYKLDSIELILFDKTGSVFIFSEIVLTA